MSAQTYQLAKNNMGRNALHGGVVGFDKVMWSARVTSGADFAGVEFKYLSHDGEEGYPGNVNVRGPRVAVESLRGISSMQRDCVRGRACVRCR